MRKAWTPPSMEGSWRLRPSFICDDWSCFEEGICLAGTSYTWRIADLSNSTWRRHTTTCSCARVSSSEVKGSRAHYFIG
jgi:hypothetical protein